jgi:hypothetical protein
MSAQLFLIAKADRSWKNISQYQDERAQGRSTARNGKAIAGAGATGVGLSVAATQRYPKHAGTFDRAARGMRRESDQRLIRNTGLREQKAARAQYDAGWRSAGSGPHQIPLADYELGARGRANAKATFRGFGNVLRRNPGVAAAVGSAGLVATGAGMYGAGRSKARRSEANIARLRRTRAKTR